ncbi:hypothetical protein TNCV_4711251 [Trichonephila clavipes]|uniref:Uncharacterized protein n=1 Tax=Trichonephila clavipes TaxID=2585209 RepID=A0A8X6VA01_TRICX|nr:hypothetical protein TNCV_4711251 [Trichonephila clavipes]
MFNIPAMLPRGGAAVKSIHPNYDTGCRTNVVMYSATVQQSLSRCSMYQQCVLEGVRKWNPIPPNYDTGCRTNVVMYNATVQQPLSRCSMYQQCVLEGCGSGINSTQTMIPDAGPIRVVMYNATIRLSADVQCTSIS